MDGLAFDDRDMGLLLREQTGYLAATPSSTLSWSMMAAEFFLATGEEQYRFSVLEAARSVTRYGLKPDGRSHNTMLGGRVYGDNGSWFSLASPVVRLKVASRPARVTIGEKAASPSETLDAQDAWTYNKDSRILLIAHRDPRVQVTF